MLLSVEEDGDVESFARFLAEEPSSEDESDEESLELESEDESLELESDSGSGVLVAAFNAFLSAFFGESFSDSEESDEESDDELSLLSESESDEESSDEDSDEVSLALESFAFFVLRASSSDSDDDADDESLDSAFRFTPVTGLEAGAGVGATSSSSSSSASLSELDEEKEEEEEEEDEDEEEEEEEELEDFFAVFGASPISTSESLDSSELLSLSLLSLSLLSLSLELLGELGLADRFTFVPFFWLSQVWKISSSDGTFVGSGWDLVAAFLDCSLARASLVLSKPNSRRKLAMEATRVVGGDVC